MNNSDNLFNGLLTKAFNEGLESTRKDNNPAYIRLVLALVGILLFVGNEAVKVLFRKNFGYHGISMTRVVACFLCFIIFGIASISFSITSDFDRISDMWFGKISFFVSGLFYVVLSFYLLGKALLQRKDAIQRQDQSDYQGDSDLLEALHLHGWSRSRIKYLAEPLYTLLLGVAVLFFNPFASIPFFACAISVWGFGVLEFIFIQQPFSPNLTPQDIQQRQPIHSNGNRVETDFN